MLGSSIFNRVFYRFAQPANRAMPIFVAVAVISVASTLLIFWMGVRVLAVNQALIRNWEVRTGLEDLLSTLKDVEAGQRSFVLTGDEKYLQPYESAVQRVSSHLGQLDDFVRTGHIAADDVTVVARLTRARLDQLKQTIEMRRQQGFEAAKTRVQSGVGEGIADDLRRQIKVMEDRERAELSVSRKRREAVVLRRTLVTAGASLVTLLFLLWAYRQIQQGISSVQRQKELLAVTLASIGDGVIVTDLQGRVTFLNAEAQRLTGWNPSEAQNQLLPTVFKIINEQTRQPVESPVDKVRRLGAVVVGLANHTILIARDGREIPIDDSGASIRDREGTVRGVVLVFRDFTDAKQAQKVLKESEERFRTIVDAMPQLAWGAKADGWITWYNRRWYEYTGTELQQMEGWGWQSVHDPMTLPKVTEQWKASIATGEPFEMVFPLRGADGQFRPFLTRVQPLKDAQGQVVEWFGTCTDVEELKRAEDAMRESGAKFRSLFENSLDAMFLTIPDGTVLAANPAACAMFGMSQEELCRIGRAGITNNADPRHIPALVERARTGSLATELSYVRKDGSVFPTDVRSVVLGDDKNQSFVILTDITERKRREHEIQQLNRTLKALSDSSHALGRAKQETQYLAEICRIIQDDCGHAMVWVGYADTDEAKTVRPVAWAGFEDGFLETLRITWADTQRGQGSTGTAIRTGRASVCNDALTDPRTLPWRNEWIARGVHSSIALPLMREGSVLGALAIYSRQPNPFSESEVELLAQLASDVAYGIESIRLLEGKERSQRDLHEAKEAAEAASKAKDQFMAVLSHELRNPLNPVMATASLLRDDPRFDADIRNQLEIICRNAELAARLIDDLLDVTRIQRGKVALDRRCIDLSTIIRRAVDDCMADIKVKHLESGVDLGTVPHWVDADAGRLQQVFWNLLKNAIKFTPPGGCVRVQVRTEQAPAPAQTSTSPQRAAGSVSFVIAQVSDSGEGMESEAIGRIFHAFEQAERSITRQFGGLGLGLTISKALVEMHGGTIQAYSPGKGKGSTFTVRLPLVSPDAAVDATPPLSEAPPAKTPTRSLRILLVEDHVDTAIIMRRVLSAQGHAVHIAGNVATALQLAGQQTFDLLLSDLGLPDGSGLDLMRALRAKGINLPGIALSGYGQEADIQASRTAGFIAHLVKPVNLPKLKEEITKAAGNTLPIAGRP